MTTSRKRSARVGLVTDQTGPLSFMGIANVNVTKMVINGPVVDGAEKLYLYPEQYEGQESHPLIFCTGPVPAQQVARA